MTVGEVTLSPTLSKEANAHASCLGTISTNSAAIWRAAKAQSVPLFSITVLCLCLSVVSCMYWIAVFTLSAFKCRQWWSRLHLFNQGLCPCLNPLWIGLGKCHSFDLSWPGIIFCQYSWGALCGQHMRGGFPHSPGQPKFSPCSYLNLVSLLTQTQWFTQRSSKSIKVFKFNDSVAAQVYDATNQRLAFASRSGVLKLFSVAGGDFWSIHLFIISLIQSAVDLIKLWAVAEASQATPVSLAFFGGGSQSLLVHKLENGEMYVQ